MGRLFQLCQESHVLDWGRQIGDHGGHGRSPFVRVPVGLDPCGRKCRGARTAYCYEMSLRLAKELENVAASVRGDAKTKVESNARVAEWLSGRGGHDLQSSSPATKTQQGSRIPGAGRSSVIV